MLAELQAKHPLPKLPQLHWKSFRTTAGRADYQTWTIQLGPAVLDTEEKLRSTLTHEYAHLLAFSRAGRRGWGHGPAWRQAMIELGQPPEVFHRYPVKRNQSRQAVQYRCLRCGVTFMRLRLLPRKQRFMHGGCGGKIEFVARVALTDSREPA